MARMSIDDMVQRDPRIMKLANLVGWSKRETVGCLVIDIWPICYDQREHIISIDLVDIAAGKEGFAAAMVAAELAEMVRGNRKVRIKGARERIEYLDNARESGRVGGLKSGESRRRKRRVTGSDPEGSPNPSAPDPVPDPSPASVPDPPPDPVPVPDRERDARKSLRDRVWSRLSDLRLAVANEFGIPNVLPLPKPSPAFHTQGFRDLGERIREEGDGAEIACERVLANLERQARAVRSVEWLSEKALGAKAWARARNNDTGGKSANEPTAAEVAFAIATGGGT